MQGKPFLFILTSHAELGDTGRLTGFHFSEMAQPYLILTDHGVEVEIASIQGGEPPADPASVNKPDESEAEIIRNFKRDRVAMEKLANTISIKDINIDDYSGVYFPGGHGTMWDFVGNATLARIVEDAWHNGKIIAAVCHGPAALVDARNGGGAPIVSGMSVNSFTDEEERKARKDKIVPFLLESRLRELGARFRKAPPMHPCLAADGQLITGQNPASAAAVAHAILAKLGIEKAPRQDSHTRHGT